MLSYSINSNWCIVNSKTFEECANVHLDHKGDQTDESLVIEDFVNADNTLYIVPKKYDDPPACELEINSANHISIKTIKIVSNCRLIEIYNKSHYLSTKDCDLIDEFEGISSYKTKIVLPCSSKQVNLKFMKNVDLWIFGLQIILQECDPTTAQINLDNVNQLLSNVALTDKAQKCKQFIETNQKTTPPSLDTVMSMISKSNFSPIQMSTKEQTKEDIQSYIDHRFRLFEQCITEKIDQQTEKLDKILAILHANKI